MEPAWKRVLGGVCGIGIVIAVIWFARQRGTSGKTIQQWQTWIVFGAAAAGLAVWLGRRPKRP